MSEFRVFVFLPSKLTRNEIGFINGFTAKTAETLTFYILDENISGDCKNSIGYCSERTPDNGIGKRLQDSEWLHINSKTGKIKVNNCSEVIESAITCIEYDYPTFLKCETLELFPENYGERFKVLIEAVRRKEAKAFKRQSQLGLSLLGACTIWLNFILRLLRFVKPLGYYSAVIQQLDNSVNVWNWVLVPTHHKRSNLSVVNALIAKLLDFILGLLVLYYFFKYERQIITFIAVMTENLIEKIKELLVILMGSPVGLKLNYKLSQNLGQFFLYHISLWEAFLQTSKPLLNYSVYLLVIPGAFGLSYQAALLSDLIAFASFHVYCIYVYAARLYGLQIKGIISLWRLFLGRKYNPLRQRVDSHQYTNNQLFIGTLGFTLLLFLLPTTLLYYTVFTVLRLAFKTAGGILLRLRYLLQCLPVYVVALWLVRSPKIAGSVYLKLEKSPFAIHATLRSISLWTSIVRSSKDEFVGYPATSWGATFKGVFGGSLL